MKKPTFDENYLIDQLNALLTIPSPSGYTDRIVHHVGDELERLDIPYEVTRRGAIRATLSGKQNTLDRAVCTHLDTIGAMVRMLKDNGRLSVAPVGTWSSRFAEGARVTVFTGKKQFRGTVLPLKASGHVYGDEVDAQPVNWDQVEIRVDARCENKKALSEKGFEVGDYVAFDSRPEITDGYINARHLDNKAGTAVLLTAAKALKESGAVLPVDCHLLFTIFEEVGIGATEVLYSDITEMVVIDCAMVSTDNNSCEHAVTLAAMDQAGPFDYHLNQKLSRLCRSNGIDFRKDVFRFYRSDSASAIEAGSDIRTALVGFGIDGSHGYERTHISSLLNTASLAAAYMQSPPTFSRDKDELGSIKGFPNQPSRDVIHIET